LSTARLDETDVRILELLQENGRMKRNRIAEEVGLSVPAVSERMRKLVERGVLEGYHALVSARRLGYDITAFIRVTVDGSENYSGFVDRASALDEIHEVHSITGDGSHILRVLTANTSTLERLLSRIQSWTGVHGTSTSIVLSSFKDTRVVQPRAMILEPALDDQSN
jgi:Lrp/AsnC family leucine-responsive transcriptional regulator